MRSAPILLFMLATPVAAAPLKVDLNQPGRPNAADPAFERWDVEGGRSFSRTFAGVTVTFTHTGSNGSGLKSTWYKTFAENADLNARMISDGLTVDETTTGAAIEMRIAGLAPGTHTLLTYHNTCDNPTVGPFSPIHIELDGTRVVEGLQPSNRVDDNSRAPVAYLTFDATAGSDTVLVFAADTSNPADLVQNVVLNGFEIDTPNASRQTRAPSPADGDFHVDADDGSATLTWEAAASGASVSYDIYFGTDPIAVDLAGPAAPQFAGNQSALSYTASGLDSRQSYYWRVDGVDALGNTTRGNVWQFRPRHLAFPGAEGHGRFAIGGRRGRVVAVDSLEDHPGDPLPGTLRHAIEVESGPRTIVFHIGGLITLGARLTLSDDFVTIAGQTAPGKGICVRGWTLGLSGAGDAIVRHLRVRPGNISGATIDGMGLQGCDHSIIDQCSISWTIDEAFSSRSARNITLQRTLISEALNVAGHQNYPPGASHGFAASIGGDIGSFHHNLLAHCYGRNWSLAGGLDGDGFFAGRLDITNNVVYNWGRRTTDGGAMEVNFVNNYYQPGPATEYFFALNAQYDNFPGTQRYYFAGNVMPGHFDESNQVAGRTETASNGGSLPTYENFVSTPFFDSAVETQSATAAYKRVLSAVGCSQPLLDDHDLRVIGETLAGTTTYQGSTSLAPGLPDSQDDVGGWEDYPVTVRTAGWDTDGDGLPAWWEALQGSDPNSPAGDLSDTHADPDGDGYTSLEDYLHWLAAPHFHCREDGFVDIDLAALFRGFTQSPAYAFTAATRCSAVTLPGTSSARITPDRGFAGLASVSITVTDSTGDHMTVTVGLRVLPSAAPAGTVLRIAPSGDRLELRATVPPGESATLEHSSELSTWSPMATIPGSDATRILPLPQTPHQYYRTRPTD